MDETKNNAKVSYDQTYGMRLVVSSWLVVSDLEQKIT